MYRNKFCKKKKFFFFNCYAPQGDKKSNLKKFLEKKNFFRNLFKYIKKNFYGKKNLILSGDFNIAQKDLDIGISEKQKKYWIKSKKCSFLPEEREWIKKIENLGLTDIYRFTYPFHRKFSWYDYRYFKKYKIGMRIDTIFISKNLINCVKKISMMQKFREYNRPSDHIPILIEIKI
ncbi:exodeoxyribonuclease III [bacterium endosymbiont of Pedicinus badii]|uniref:exodeoxyribonuclease III n=1 Tax=bacterium endosymbiont of Pedicinus badii TaxID=1719126 RepID=UPI0009BC6C9C|nr:exodeoxyribonuclease III [bacterium endosymbiont of Pedicinus badii]